MLPVPGGGGGGNSPSTRTTLESCSTEVPQAACTVTRTSPVSPNRVVTEFSRDSRGCGHERGSGLGRRAGPGVRPGLH